MREILGVIPRSAVHNGRSLVELLIDDGILYVLAIVGQLVTALISP
jgi:hypothetical protein